MRSISSLEKLGNLCDQLCEDELEILDNPEQIQKTKDALFHIACGEERAMRRKSTETPSAVTQNTPSQDLRRPLSNQPTGLNTDRKVIITSDFKVPKPASIPKE